MNPRTPFALPILPGLSPTRSRLRLYLPTCYQQEPIISRLITDYKLIVNITGAKLAKHVPDHCWLDLELHGTPPQISRGLDYLRSLQLNIIGKPNPAGDSWSY
jgi:hypothetical protein